MELVAKLKRTWNLAPALQIVQKSSENYCPCLHLSIGQVWWLNEFLVLCTNTHHDVTELVNYGMVKNTRTWISWKQNGTFLWNKKILNLCFIWHILRSYGLLTEVAFNKKIPWQVPFFGKLTKMIVKFCRISQRTEAVIVNVKHKFHLESCVH